MMLVLLFEIPTVTLRLQSLNGWMKDDERHIRGGNRDLLGDHMQSCYAIASSKDKEKKEGISASIDQIFTVQHKNAAMKKCPSSTQ